MFTPRSDKAAQTRASAPGRLFKKSASWVATSIEDMGASGRCRTQRPRPPQEETRTCSGSIRENRGMSSPPSPPTPSTPKGPTKKRRPPYRKRRSTQTTLTSPATRQDVNVVRKSNARFMTSRKFSDLEPKYCGVAIRETRIQLPPATKDPVALRELFPRCVKLTQAPSMDHPATGSYGSGAKPARFNPLWRTTLPRIRRQTAPVRWFSTINSIGPWSIPRVSVAHQFRDRLNASRNP